MFAKTRRNVAAAVLAGAFLVGGAPASVASAGEAVVGLDSAGVPMTVSILEVGNSLTPPAKAAPSDSVLPRTGAQIALMAALATAATLTGVGLVTTRRRTRAH